MDIRGTEASNHGAAQEVNAITGSGIIAQAGRGRGNAYIVVRGSAFVGPEAEQHRRLDAFQAVMGLDVGFQGVSVMAWYLSEPSVPLSRGGGDQMQRQIRVRGAGEAVVEDFR